jgi:hypothetical protein
MWRSILSGVLNLMHGGCSAMGELESSSSTETLAVLAVEKTPHRQNFGAETISLNTIVWMFGCCTTKFSQITRPGSISNIGWWICNLYTQYEHWHTHHDLTNPAARPQRFDSMNDYAAPWGAQSRSFRDMPLVSAGKTLHSKACILWPVLCGQKKKRTLGSTDVCWLHSSQKRKERT